MSRNGGVPGWLRGSYEKFGLDPNEENSSAGSQNRSKWVCPRCGTTNWSDNYKCKSCGNINPYS